MFGGYFSFQGIDGRARWRGTPTEEASHNRARRGAISSGCGKAERAPGRETVIAAAAVAASSARGSMPPQGAGQR
jgi:hypothetical protein